jgi:hypothetical protein
MDVSGVVAKELIEETEDALLLWGSRGHWTSGFRLGWLCFIDGDRQGQSSE